MAQLDRFTPMARRPSRRAEFFRRSNGTSPSLDGSTGDRGAASPWRG